MPDAPSMRERMLAGELYIADDAELGEQSARARALTHRLSMSDPSDAAHIAPSSQSCWLRSGRGASFARRSIASTAIRPLSECAAL